MVLSASGLKLAAQTPATFYTTYQFASDNGIPGSALTRGWHGELFGTSYSGSGNGTVFGLMPAGTYGYMPVPVHTFSGGLDGGSPYAGLIRDQKTLFGTTQSGGNAGGGVLFSVNTDGSSYSVLHNFNNNTEGANAQGTPSCFHLPDFSGLQALFGNLSIGGSSYDAGALYALVISNGIVLQVSFPRIFSGMDGKFPVGRLSSMMSAGAMVKSGVTAKVSGIDLSTVTLYGVTKTGGSNNWGEVYSINGDGSGFRQLHAFNFGTTDGYLPQGGLVLSGSTLYGTSSGGGSNYSGTVFQINTDGSGFKLLFNFNSSITGGSPQGDLILSGDTLYGTTYGGGSGGGGVVYSINTNGGNFTVLHNFASPMNNGNGVYTNIDGGWSVAGLLLANNTLYGTTPYGGTNGLGTAYEIILPSPPVLNIGRTGGNFKISWPSIITGYALQQNLNLGTTNWSTNGLTIADDGTNKSVTIVPTTGKAFFRLSQ